MMNTRKLFSIISFALFFCCINQIKAQSPPPNAVAHWQGGWQLYFQDMVKSFKGGGDIHFWQIQNSQTGWRLLRKGFNDQGQAKTEIIKLAVAGNFLVVAGPATAVWYRECFSPDCQGVEVPATQGSGCNGWDPNNNEGCWGIPGTETVDGGFCNPNNDNSACNCSNTATDCTFGISGVPMGWVDVVWRP